VVDDMEALMVVTQDSLMEIYPAIKATNNSELELNLNTLIVLTGDTAEKLSDIELLEFYEMHPASLVRLLLDLLTMSGRMRDALGLFVIALPDDLKEVIVRAIDLRNLWVRMAMRNSVMHNLRAKEVLVIESDDERILAAQRLYLFNDIKKLLTWGFRKKFALVS